MELLPQGSSIPLKPEVQNSNFPITGCSDRAGNESKSPLSSAWYIALWHLVSLPSQWTFKHLLKERRHEGNYELGNDCCQPFNIYQLPIRHTLCTLNYSRCWALSVITNLLKLKVRFLKISYQRDDVSTVDMFFERVILMCVNEYLQRRHRNASFSNEIMFKLRLRANELEKRRYGRESSRGEREEGGFSKLK